MKNSNIKALQESGLSFQLKNCNEVACFRATGRPRVDFYISSGIWISDQGTRQKGSVQEFITWYKRLGMEMLENDLKLVLYKHGKQHLYADVLEYLKAC